MEQFEGLYEEEEKSLFKNIKKESKDAKHNKNYFNNDDPSFLFLCCFFLINYGGWIVLRILFISFLADTFLVKMKIAEIIGFGSLMLCLYLSTITHKGIRSAYYYLYRKKSLCKTGIKLKKWNFFGVKEQKVQLLDSELGPYLQIFNGKDAYNQDGNMDILLRNAEFNNVEIFLEKPEIIIGVGKRSVFTETDQYFIDIINKETQKVKRIFVEELNYMYNTFDEIIVSRKNQDQFDIVHLDINTLEENKIIHEESVAFFKIIYNKTSNTWGKLYYNYTKNGISFFKYESIRLKDQDFVFESFDKETYLINSQYNVLNI